MHINSEHASFLSVILMKSVVVASVFSCGWATVASCPVLYLHPQWVRMFGWLRSWQKCQKKHSCVPRANWRCLKDTLHYGAMVRSFCLDFWKPSRICNLPFLLQGNVLEGSLELNYHITGRNCSPGSHLQLKGKKQRETHSLCWASKTIFRKVCIIKAAAPKGHIDAKTKLQCVRAFQVKLLIASMMSPLQTRQS